MVLADVSRQRWFVVSEVSSPVWSGGWYVEGRGRRCSQWWCEVVRIRDGGSGVGGGWFRENISKKVGDGMDTLFWTDSWLGGIPLAVRFRHLYDLSVNKNCLVGEMFALGVEEGGVAWQWRRRLWDWEEDLVRECRVLLSDVTLNVSIVDRWNSHLDNNGGYSVHSVYHMLTADDSQVLDNNGGTNRHRQKCLSWLGVFSAIGCLPNLICWLA